MKKRVNVKITSPIYTIRPILQRSVMNTEMTVGDIRNCICSKAIVEEILEDGTIVPLNLYNYNRDNSNKMKHKPIKKEEAKKEIVKPKPTVAAKAPEVKKPQEAVNVKITEKQEQKEEVKKEVVKPTVAAKAPEVKKPQEVKQEEVKEEKK